MDISLNAVGICLALQLGEFVYTANVTSDKHDEFEQSSTLCVSLSFSRTLEKRNFVASMVTFLAMVLDLQSVKRFGGVQNPLHSQTSKKRTNK